jgi:hypothetical protein
VRRNRGFAAVGQVVEFPQFTRYGPQREADRRQLARMFAGKSVAEMRYMWDNIGDDSFYHSPDGLAYDCSDIHSYMNMIGDGVYCAV